MRSNRSKQPCAPKPKSTRSIEATKPNVPSSDFFGEPLFKLIKRFNAVTMITKISEFLLGKSTTEK